MLFNSLNFLIFFPIVVILYFVIPDKAKQYWLLATSYYFYMCWNVKYVLLILFSTIATFLCGLLTERTSRKKLAVSLCITINLLILFFFKYYGFLTGSVESVFSLAGISIKTPKFDVMLPVGISFYTFQALGYTIDVYRGSIKAERNFFKYALFVSFFPQLVAGPIERSQSLLPQLEKPHKLDIDRFREGFLLMLWGYFLKVVIADRVAIIVDTVYDNVDIYPGLYQILAAGLFAFQIYTDFGGYSTIAIGSAKILGIDIMQNFDAPYLASSVSEFWRRWHISLTTWFRDYLYIPLGGNRKGMIRKHLNQLLVFAVSGLWHGADWSFVIWGALNGLYLVTGEILMPIRLKLRQLLRINKDSIIYRSCAIGITFAMVDAAWIFFRAKDTMQAIQVFKQIFSTFNPQTLFTGGRIFKLGVEKPQFIMMFISILILIAADILKYNRIDIIGRLLKTNAFARGAIVVLSVLFILTFGAWGPEFDIANFIYFQF